MSTGCEWDKGSYCKSLGVRLKASHKILWAGRDHMEIPGQYMQYPEGKEYPVGWRPPWTCSKV